MIPDYSKNCPNAVHLGFRLLQNRHAVPFWSHVIDVLKPSDIVEIGTWEGGLTACLGIAARNIGATVHTFGLEEISPDNQWWFSHLPILFYRGDFFSEKAFETLSDLRAKAKGTMLWLCDGGNKPKEFDICSDIAGQGDVVAAHDFAGPTWPWSEITEDRVLPACEASNLKPWLAEEGAEAGWLVRRKI